MFRKFTNRLPAIPELPELPPLPDLSTLRLYEYASQVTLPTLNPSAPAVLQLSKDPEDSQELENWEHVEEKWEDSDVEELLEKAKYLPLDSPDARKEMDYFGSKDQQNHINIQRRAAAVKKQAEVDKKTAILRQPYISFRKIPKPPAISLDSEWEEERDKEDFAESNFMYCRPSMRKEFEDYHGTPYAQEALRLDKERRERKRRAEVAAIQDARRKADWERKLRENEEFAQPLLEALARQKKEKAEAEWLLVSPMDDEALRLEMQGRKDVDLKLEKEAPSYEASIEGRGKAGPEAPRHSMIDFELMSSPNTSEPLYVESIESTPVQELKSLIDPDAPQVELVFNASDQSPSPVQFPKRLLAAFSPFLRAHFARSDVAHDVVYLHLTEIDHATFMLLYRWMHMVCLGKYTPGTHRPEPYEPSDTILQLPELGAHQSLKTQVKLFCALNQLDIHLPKLQLRDLICTHFPIPDGPIVSTSLDNDSAPEFFPADDIRLVLNGIKLINLRRKTPVSSSSPKQHQNQVLRNRELEKEEWDESDEIEYFMHTHIARYIVLLQAFRLFRKEYARFLNEEDDAIARPLALDVQRHKNLRRCVEVWQRQVPDDVAEMEVETENSAEVDRVRMLLERDPHEGELSSAWHCGGGGIIWGRRK
ncbi:uncharacterized protein BDZ99DRAFT_538593 [Mytilinidion resinicola]|uniref:BTB domain-containing protein n=1 Tax=Mytilinidion resinicola TaxID=574789 RepID=A0A6A6YCY0_9PEZI|nr:uncharacterized protein BDZ99DRAFT_538593 [Mytilinidion resinicola]KAF2806373.1 hypothetical protein BDZ99DRAFT_538593 [Mytilinidion resinicola]